MGYIEYYKEKDTDPMVFLQRFRCTTEPIGGGTEYDEEGELVSWDAAVAAIEIAMKRLGWHPASEPPIPDAPYISVVFCKGRNGWVPFTGYGCDISPKKTVEFINRIGDATDVLNGKEE